MYMKLSASGGFAPDPPRGALPLDLVGGSRPPFRLALHALAPWQILDPPLLVRAATVVQVLQDLF